MGRELNEVAAGVLVPQASSPASSGGVSPPVPTRGETPRELAGGTPAVQNSPQIRQELDEVAEVAFGEEAGEFGGHGRQAALALGDVGDAQFQQSIFE